MNVLPWILLSVALPATGFVFEWVSRRKDGERLPPPGRMVDIGGRRLHLLAKGHRQPTVIIEQGAGGPSMAWASIQDQVAEFASVCLYDRAGYLWSDPVKGSRTIQDRVNDLHQLLANAQIPGPYILVAHSYGGFLVRLFAREHPDSVAGIVLVDTPEESGYLRPDVLTLYTRLSWFMRVIGFLSWFGLPRLLTSIFSKPDPNIAPLIEEQINAGMVRREYFAASIDDIKSLKQAAPWLIKEGALGSLGDLPLIVITHGQPFPGPFAILDKGWREGQQRLASLSANSEWIIADRANHMIHNDAPDLVADAIRRVVESARTGAPLVVATKS